MTIPKEEKITIYELFLQQLDGSYRRFIRWEGQEKWISYDSYAPYRMLPYTAATEQCFLHQI